MSDANQIHVASYSPVQRCWHIETLAQHVASNARCLGRGVLQHTAYCAIVVTESREQAHEFIRKLEAMFEERGVEYR